MGVDVDARITHTRSQTRSRAGGLIGRGLRSLGQIACSKWCPTLTHYASCGTCIDENHFTLDIFVAMVTVSDKRANLSYRAGLSPDCHLTLFNNHFRACNVAEVCDRVIMPWPLKIV